MDSQLILIPGCAADGQKAAPPRTRLIDLDQIRLDGGTQPREAIDEALVTEYRERMDAGDKFPAVILFHDGAAYWLADGFHRYHARRLAGHTNIKAEVRQGTQRDAQWFSFSANAKHGRPRDASAASRAIRRILEDAEWAKTPQNKIAEHVGVSPARVSQVKASIKGLRDAHPTRTATRNGKTYEIDTAKIGRRAETDGWVKELKRIDRAIDALERLRPYLGAIQEMRAIADRLRTRV